MVIQYFDSPFHVTHDEEVASQMAEEMKLSILITDCIKNPDAKENEVAIRSPVSHSQGSEVMSKAIIDDVVKVARRSGE
ncbi:hypothetical protein [Pseudomonas nunensis]|uniref:Transcriptional regulator n=1 Tax=Pseudomonas nunensis TaxID=2961896 RepID=A0ABY5ECP3_9PSED|nr:hypothetical protein [Pseudomonas nunensis]KOX98834.1 hypothetical protein AM274_28865 [Pseudomonas nunensis]KPN89198.1 hypothetical protein AL066_24170 [Pseudomonas nunensis]MCL5227610.1 transcriptional regulator [Pseudomonas nunensis]UTO13531.1 transcriptional regulator [Pseudomonas nunensis]